ncbi:MAG: glutamyl-tRNA reductase [Actinomycetes bacterium]
MSVVVIGLEHTTAPFDMLERVTVSDADVGSVLATLSAYDNIREVVVVSTCLRTEIYAVVDRFHDAVDHVTELLAARAGCDRATIEAHESVFFDRGVATHLFKIAAGLESAVPGETEVLGQVRRSLERATDEGTTGPQLTSLFRHAVHTGRRVRTETGIARGTTSFAHASVELAEAHLRGALQGAKVVILGAGALASGTVAALVDERRDQRPGEIIVVNRTTERADVLVASADSTIPISTCHLDGLAEALSGARLLICAVEADVPLVESRHVADRSRDGMLVVDLGMPRIVAKEVGDLEGVELLDISHLRSAVEQAMDERRSEVAAAIEVLTEEVDRFLEDQRGRGAAPVVVSLRERLDAIRSAEIERRSGDLAELTAQQREAVESLTRSMMAKVAHEPTVVLKESAGTPRGERLVESVRHLFGL